MSRYSTAMLVTGATTLVFASLLVWLLVTEPVALATAVNERDYADMAYAFGRALIAGFNALIDYL